MQAERILSQLEQDVEVLTQSGFIDYSLFMIVVLRPFKHVEHFKPSTLGVSQFDDVRGDDNEAALSKQSTKRLFIGDVDPRMLIRGDANQQLMLLMEKTRHRSKIFHICDAYDCATIRAWREQEELSSKPIRTTNTAEGRHSFAEEDLKQGDNEALIQEENHPLAK